MLVAGSVALDEPAAQAAPLLFAALVLSAVAGGLARYAGRDRRLVTPALVLAGAAGGVTYEGLVAFGVADSIPAISLATDVAVVVGLFLYVRVLATES